jgi:hypothetical protein
VNSKRNSNGTKASCELKFKDKVYRDPSEITEHWKLYFETLYQPSTSQIYHEEHEVQVSSIADNMKS